MTIEYKEDDVLEAARKRVAAIFDEFEDVVVSVSGGKDSTVIRHLCVEEGQRRGRRVGLLFLDQEAEYQSTIDVMERWMGDPAIDPEWYQVPLKLTNATSHQDYWLYAWGPGEEWIREKHPLAIHQLNGYPQRFYDFFTWREQQNRVKTAHVIGLRARESLNRFRAVSKGPGYLDWSWSTRGVTDLAVRVYPIYDWKFGDVWKYIADHSLFYNAHYDRLYAKSTSKKSRFRVSNLVHEKSFRTLLDLQEFEPDTFDRLVRRLGGVHCAAIYATENGVFKANELPPSFGSWREYRDYLLATTPADQVEIYRRRFARHRGDEETCRQQVGQILINDWENNVPIESPRGREQDRLRARLWDQL